jgi:hypothetical protein
VGVFDPYIKLLLGNADVGGRIEGYTTIVVGSRPAPNDPTGRLELVGIAGDGVIPLDYDRDDNFDFEGRFQSIDFVDWPSLFASGLGEPEFSAVSTADNRLVWYQGLLNTFPMAFVQRNTISVESPCFVEGTNTYWANDVIIGQVDKGLSLFEVDSGNDLAPTDNFTSTFVSRSGDGRSLCSMIRGIIPESSHTANPTVRNARIGPLTAIDHKTNELVFFGDTNDDLQLEELGTLPLEMQTSEPMQIVSVIMEGTSSQQPRYMFVLATNGQHVGEHRLILVWFEEPLREIVQTVYAWNEGVPVAMVQGQFGGNNTEGRIFRPDLAVILGTSSHSLFFDNLSPLSEGFGLPPLYGDPTMFEVGLGAGSAVAAIRPDGPHPTEPGYGILVSFSADGEVRYISP